MVVIWKWLSFYGNKVRKILFFSENVRDWQADEEEVGGKMVANWKRLEKGKVFVLKVVCEVKLNKARWILHERYLGNKTLKLRRCLQSVIVVNFVRTSTSFVGAFIKLSNILKRIHQKTTLSTNFLSQFTLFSSGFRASIMMDLTDTAQNFFNFESLSQYISMGKKCSCSWASELREAKNYHPTDAEFSLPMAAIHCDLGAFRQPHSVSCWFSCFSFFPDG
jgi:hypothetical protein